MVSTASICSCKSHSWEEQKYNPHPYIYDIVGLILILIIFALIQMLSKGPWIVSSTVGWVSNILQSVDIATCIPMKIISLNRCHPIRAKCYQHRTLCELWIDYSELLCYLYQIDQLNPVLLDYCCGFKNRRSNECKNILISSLFDHLNSLPQGYEKFIRCLRMSIEKPNSHLSHFSLLELLTSDDIALLESAEYKHNLVIREIIKVNFMGFVTMTDVNQLLPLMEKRELLTHTTHLKLRQSEH